MSEVSVGTTQTMDSGRNPWIPDWLEKFYAKTPGGRVEEVNAPGTVPFSPVGQPQPQQYGLSALGGGIQGAGDWIQKQLLNLGDAATRWITSQPQADYGQGVGSRAYSTTPEFGPGDDSARSNSSRLRGSVQGSRMGPGNEEVAPTDWLAKAMEYQNQFTPDYAGIQARLSDEALAINAQINAMYKEIAKEAEGNLGRVKDIYGGSEAGIGQAYDIGTGNIEQAYQSAQQQAADQMARLGVEAAAPAVMDPMALSQAEAVAGLETGRSAGLSANERYGSTAQNFASQMAQATQQEGAEYQTSVADSLRRQLLNIELQQQQDAYNRAMQAPGLAQDLFSASQIGQPQGMTWEQQFAENQEAFKRAESAARIEMEYGKRASEAYTYLTSREGGRLSHEEALAQIELRRQAGVL
jgi:hypothetical protein